MSDWEDSDVAEEKKTYTTQELDVLIKDMLDKRDDYETAKNVSNEADEKHKIAKAKVLSALQSLGKSKYYAEGLGTVSKVTTMKVTVPKDDASKKLFFQYLQERGLFDSMATVNYQTLNAFYNEEAEAAKARGELLSVPGVDMPIAEDNLRFTKSK